MSSNLTKKINKKYHWEIRRCFPYQKKVQHLKAVELIIPVSSCRKVFQNNWLLFVLPWRCSSFNVSTLATSVMPKFFQRAEYWGVRWRQQRHQRCRWRVTPSSGIRKWEVGWLRMSGRRGGQLLPFHRAHYVTRSILSIGRGLSTVFFA